MFYHAQTNNKRHMESLLHLFCFCPRNMIDTDPGKIQSNHNNVSENINKKGKAFSLYMRFKNTRFKFQIETHLQNWAGGRGNATCSHHYLFRDRLLVVSLDGWRIRQCNWYRPSPCVFRTASTPTIFTLIGNDLLNCRTRSRQKVSSFLRYLSEIKTDS